MKQKTYNFLICGYYGAGNLGDDLILDSMVSELNSKFMNSQIFVTAMENSYIEKKYKNVRCVYYNNFYAISSIMPYISVVIIGGGGLLFEDKKTNPDVVAASFYGSYGGLPTISSYTIIAKIFNKPLIIWSVGIGDFYTKQGKAIALYILNQADKVFLRDSDSIDIARKIGYKKEIVKTPDEAMRLGLNEPSNIAKEKVLTVSLREYQGVESDIAEIAKYVDLCQQLGYKVQLIPFQRGSDASADDVTVLLRLKSVLKDPEGAILIEKDRLFYFRKSKIVITSRLHAVILGTLFDAKIVAIGYDRKIASYLREIGLESIVLQPGQSSFDEIKKIVSSQEVGRVVFSPPALSLADELSKIGKGLIKHKKILINKTELDKRPFASKAVEREFGELRSSFYKLEKKYFSQEKQILEIINSETWRYGVMLTTAIKDPKQIPAIIKRLLIKIAKKLLPADTRTRVKKFMGKHPYIANPRILIHLRKNKKTLKEILEKEKYKGIIIYPPTIDWDMPLFQRPQQLALAFAKEGYLFFYGTANLNHDKVNGFKRVENNLYVTNQVELLRGVEGTTLFISWPINKYFVEKFPKAKLIYDYIDELDVFDAAGATEKEMIKNHKELVREADLVVCTADKLLNDVKKLNPKKAILAPNAVTLSHFSVKPKKAAEDIGEFVKAKKKIIGYYGAIAEWFDYDLLEKIAELRPEYEFVMIGPLDYDKTLSHNKHLFEIKNIHFIGAKKFEELPSYLYYFDVAIIPFLINKITESTSPVKLFEYMAGGRPIVTTPMHECKKYKSVLIADGAGEFVAKLDEAIRLKEYRDYKNQLAQDAKENTWKARVEQIIKNIN